MPVYVVTGKLGSGKTLACVGRIFDYINKGRRVATNLDLNLEHLTGNYAKCTQVFRVPNRPTVESLNALPIGYDGEFVGESKNGALVLDECGTWFNSRDYKAQGRKELLDWIIHARKLRWDVYFIIQDISVMDKQARDMFAEHVVYCRRTDRVPFPFISPLYKLIVGKPLPMPKIHLGIVHYGADYHAPKVEVWKYLGWKYYDAYDTQQVFKETTDGTYQYLPSYYTHGRYTTKWDDYKNAVKNIKIEGFHFFFFGALMAAFVTNATVTYHPDEPKKGFFSCNQYYKDLYGDCDNPPVLTEQIELVKKIKNLKVGEKINEKVIKNDNPIIKKKVDDSPIYITGSVKRNDGFDYLFVKNDKPFDAWLSGSDITWISPCKALIDGVKVTCKPYSEESYSSED